MKKFDYDLLLTKSRFYTHYIAEQNSQNLTMKNIHNHSHYEILYIPDGERILVAEKSKYSLNRNCIALVPPYTLHRTLKSSEYTREYYKKYLINFTRDFVAKISMAMDIDIFAAFQQNIILIQFDNEEETEFVKNTMVQMLKYNNTGNLYDEQMFRVLLCGLLTFLAKKTSKETIYNESVVTDKIVAYMENNFEENITLETLAKQFFISKYEISRMFTKNVGISFVEYLTRIRIENSKKLLQETTLSITQISELTGFHSSSNFARVFKKLTGISPMSYRKENYSENE